MLVGGMDEVKLRLFSPNNGRTRGMCLGFPKVRQVPNARHSAAETHRTIANPPTKRMCSTVSS